MNGTIYKITHKDSSKAYIGQTWHVSQRWNKYKRLDCKEQPKIYRALKKYGIDMFNFKILRNNIQNQNELDIQECYWMDKYDTIAKGYNIKEGGAHGKLTQETIKKRSTTYLTNNLAKYGLTFPQDLEEYKRIKKKEHHKHIAEYKKNNIHRKEHIAKYNKNYNLKNKEDLYDKQKEYRRKYRQEWRKKNPNYAKEYWIKYKERRTACSAP